MLRETFVSVGGGRCMLAVVFFLGVGHFVTEAGLESLIEDAED